MLEIIDITNKHERDQFTASLGIVFTEMGLLGQYENAINIIIKELKSSKTRVDTVSHPILYMMRHSLELGYKRNFEYFANYSNRQTSKKLFESHNLDKLHAEFKMHFDLISDTLKIANDIQTDFNRYYENTTELIKHLEPSEPSSFRYIKTTKGKKLFESTATKDIGELKGLYDKAITMLTHTVDVISPYTDYKELIDKIPDLKGGTGIVLMTFPSFQLNFIAKKIDAKFEKIDQLKWKHSIEGQILVLITLGKNCYLTPLKQENSL